MAVVRANVLTSPHTPTYVAGVLLLSQRASSITPDQLNASSIVQRAPDARIFGTAMERSRPLSWWDLLTWWHVAAMNWLTVPTGNRRMAAQFLHLGNRLFIRRLAEAIQAITGDATFALPYWDWAQDGQLSSIGQLSASIWTQVGPLRG